MVGLAGVASRVTVGARVSICFGSSYSTLSGPPQIGLGGEQGERERERGRGEGGGGGGGGGRGEREEAVEEGGLSCCGIGRLGYLGNHIKV